ncbi:hypothetical protein [Elizabethkingia sp. YR214]|uniref:hypothetical protein n=1 Tax=Elizabethkingia sp. YR214 TaxID=2135667 RepID=UPI000D30DBD4|nr:hypothetical protein [Elizabethkingia sp. YR214]
MRDQLYNVLSTAFFSDWNWGGFLKAIAFGALGGAVSVGIGSLFQAAAHSISQGISKCGTRRRLFTGFCFRWL